MLRNSAETSIGRFLTSPELLRDPTNHCVPILDSFPDELSNEISFIVMPMLRRFNDPPFDSVDEVVSFAEQCMEVGTFYYILELYPLICSLIGPCLYA